MTKNSSYVTIDSVKDFWDSRPCNILHSNKAIGTLEYFEEVEKRKYFVEPHIPKFAQFERWKGKKVLEIGCGIGTDAVNFARAGAEYTGVELSNTSLEIAKMRFGVYGLRGEFLLADAESLDSVLVPQYFDLIYSFGVLHHTPNFKESLKQILNYVSEESEIKIMLYAKNSWKQTMINIGIDQPEAQFGCPIANSYTKEELEVLFLECGLKIDSYTQDHIFPYIVEDYKKYDYIIESWFKTMPREMFEALEKSFGWHGLIHASKAK
jgi:ubiquinone/menaquinone biosynthesis C-methylase UbiE